MKNYEIEINGETYQVAVKELAADADMTENKQTTTDAPVVEKTEDPAPIASTEASGTEVNAPMPGTIMSVEVSDGQKVAQGDVLAILEAMKMENEIIAPTDGVIQEILVHQNDSVKSDQVLFIL